MKFLFYVRGRESIGVGHLMAAVRRAGHEARLLFDPGLDDNLTARAPWLRPLGRRRRLLRLARSYAPDVIGITCLTNHWPHVRQAAADLKAATGAVTLAGGVHASLAPEVVLAAREIDGAALGEADETLPELARRLAAGEDWQATPGFVFRGPAGLRSTGPAPPPADLDALPLPDRDTFHRAGAFGRTVEAIASRGCTHACAFCASRIHRQRAAPAAYLRRRSPASFLAELEDYARRFKARRFLFHDENFSADPAWLAEFCRGYSRRIGLPFFCLAHPASIDATAAIRLSAAGCREVFVGIDSGDTFVRRQVLERHVSEERIVEACRAIRAAGMRLQVSAMFVVPDEDLDAMMRTVRLVRRVRPDSVASFLFYPFPGFALTDRAIAGGYLDEARRQLAAAGAPGYSVHQSSLLDHPYRRQGENLANLLPLVARLPAGIGDRLLARGLAASPRATHRLYTATALTNLGYMARMAAALWRPGRGGRL